VPGQYLGSAAGHPGGGGDGGGPEESLGQVGAGGVEQVELVLVFDALGQDVVELIAADTDGRTARRKAA